MSENFRNAALLFFATLEGKNQEEITEARLNLFNAAMTEPPAEEDNIDLDLEKMREQLNAPADAPIFQAYKMWIAGFNAGLNALTALLEAQ